MVVAQEQINQASSDTGGERLQSIANPARHMPAADLPIHALLDREQNPLPQPPVPDHLLHPGKHTPNGSIVRPAPQEEWFVRGNPPDLVEPDGAVKREQPPVRRSKDALRADALNRAARSSSSRWML
jgi:hypothetical protein